LYAVASDVTQLVENQTALNAADNFQYLIRQHDHCFTRKKKINPAMVETLGYTEEELLMHPFDFVHADDKENTQN
jgi:PAS domain-containing protein